MGKADAFSKMFVSGISGANAGMVFNSVKYWPKRDLFRTTTCVSGFLSLYAFTAFSVSTQLPQPDNSSIRIVFLSAPTFLNSVAVEAIFVRRPDLLPIQAHKNTLRMLSA